MEDETCFYCDDSVHEHNIHHISFFHEDQERHETLCDTCYSEWLEGIKE